MNTTTKRLGQHVKIEILNNCDTVLFYSYNKPVAAEINGEYYKLDYSPSKTTTKHINKWLDGVKAEEKPEKFFDDLKV